MPLNLKYLMKDTLEYSLSHQNCKASQMVAGDFN